ncbi:Dyp-type peroxidase [Kitasatospora kifunensis]|uniref:Putative iron-dependent peroxidase n=1 Tax=Kitasatospora kifunensis TaxID=58351 RepID=A0A7W7R8B8_KITKI|nr:Dyp-type peroxidase [Kitasatospora kifunensis]MBB4927140.1 putative iron-dependent peroxidase [Kitasatospora kifunensis]
MTAVEQADPQPQPVRAPLSTAALFLVLTVRPGGEQTVRELLPELAALRRSVGFRAAEARLSCVLGVGSALWDRLFAPPRPAELHPFRELRGERHTAPATPGDLLLHLRAERQDACFELAGLLLAHLDDAVDVVDEVTGFGYVDRRDLLGFVDGTENPEGVDADQAALIGAEDRDFAGGSYVLVQKYLHDLVSWRALPVEQQERAVGRSKLSDVELPASEQPVDSHVALTSLDPVDGREREIVRLNMPFGSYASGEFGTYFIGYCRTPAVTEEMLENMFLGRPRGSHDRLLDFSTAVTGGLFFVPSADLLADPPPAAQAPAERTAPAGADGSLGVGSLKARSPHTSPDRKGVARDEQPAP